MLLLCLLNAALVCLAQIRGGGILLYASLFLFLLLSVYGTFSGLSLSFFLFFLPWSPLLKLYSGAISFYTVAMLICCLLCLAKTGYMLARYQIFLSAILLCLTLIGKALQANSVSNSYLFFFVMLLLFPNVTQEDNRRDPFYVMTIFFAMGIISAALVAQQVAGYPNISRYIMIQSYLQVTRLSGFFGDPNFYSAHITAVLAGLFLVLSREQSRKQQIVLIVLSVLLIYCGLLSASKMFVAVLAAIFLCWIPMLFQKRGGLAGKLSLLIGILCAGAVILSSVAFRKLFLILDFRFSYAANLSQLTTGRTELWRNYWKELTGNVPLLLFGEGYTPVTLGGRASHNTLIQLFFQFGLLGSAPMTYWVFMLQHRLSKGLPARKRAALPGMMLLLGVVLPWLSLDILFFDDFFLLLVYATIGATEQADRLIQPDRGLPGSTGMQSVQ